MPPAVPLIAAGAGAAVAGSAFAAATFGAIGASLVGSLVAGSINLLGSRLLAKKPKASSFSQEAQGRSLMIRSSVESHKVVYGRQRVSGTLAFVTTTSTGPDGNPAGPVTITSDNVFLHMVLVLAAHEVDAIEQIYLDDKPVTLNGEWVETAPYTASNGFRHVRIYQHLGLDSQAADPVMVSEIPGWTGDHRLRGLAYLYVRFQYAGPEYFPNGVPNVSAVVRGRKVYDPRTTLTAWSDNAALCIRDYLTSSHGFGCSADEIDDTFAVAAANLCDEPVALAAGGTEKRYTCNGVLDTESAPLENLQRLVTAVAGTVTYVGGRFRIHPAAYDAPAGSIDESALAGPVRVVARPGRNELFNAVRGTYVDPNLAWQPTDFPPATNATYEAQDNGERVFRDVELPFTTGKATAQRIARILLEKGRQGIRVTLPVMHHALRFSVHDVIGVTNAQLGWADKPFRITKWSAETNGPILLELQEESSASYQWSAEETEFDPAPDTDLPDPRFVSPPGVITIEESLYVTRSGDGVKAKATVTWEASTSPFVRDYQLEYKLVSDPAWKAVPRLGDTSHDIEDIAPGAYQFRVKAISYLGASSEYSQTARNIAGLLDPPDEPQNLTISTIGGLAVLRWDEYTGNDTLDVRIGGKVVFRHSPDITAGWNESTSIGEAAPGNATQWILPLKPGIYLAKAYDAARVPSAGTASVTTDQATALAYANVDTLTEHPTFPGAKASCVVDGGNLILTGEGSFDDIPDVDAEASIDAFGDIASSGSYGFSGVMDFTSKSRVRLTSHVKAFVFNVYDLFDSRAASIDDWASFDGDASDEADAQVWVRTTDDDPGGTPTWGVWQRCDSAEVHCRAVDAQLRLYSYDTGFNIAVEELELTADEVA